ncbi:MAG: hypothetical protein FWH53_11860 [Leptospirales bacterium]|nr:hypothetical protein [Leptospirales bacterium]
MSKLLEQVKALENGEGIQYLLDAACKIFTNPIYMIDSYYNLIAYSDVTVDDPIWNELITTGTFSLQALEVMVKENVLEDLTNSDKIILLKRDRWKGDRMSGHIFNKENIWVGQITMYEYNTPFDRETKTAYEALTDKISCEICDYDYFTTLAMTNHENRINELLDKAVNNPLIYNPQAQILYSGFEDYLYVAVVSIPRNNIIDNVHRSRLSYFKSLLKTKYKSFKYAVHSEYIVMLMSSKYNDFYDEQFFNKDNNLFKQNNMFVGISNSFENIYELREYYDQAVVALKNGIEKNNDRRVFLYNNT